MTTTERDAISSPRDGLAIYNVTLDTLDLRANGAWVSLGTGSGTVTGSGSSGQIAYWSGACAITGESALFYDAANNRLGINQATPTHSLSILAPSATDGIYLETDGTVDRDNYGIELVGTATGPYVQRGRISLDVYSNAGASPQGHAIIFNLKTDGYSNEQPLIVYRNQLTLAFAGTYAIQGTGTGNRIRIETAGGVFSTATWLLTNTSYTTCLLYTSPSPRDSLASRMPSSS